MTQWHNTHRADTDGVHAAVGRAGAQAKAAPDPLSRGARAECEIEIEGGACASERSPQEAQRITGSHPQREQQHASETLSIAFHPS